MTDYIVNGSDLTNIANKIRAKGQTSAPIVFPSGFTDAIDELPDEPVLEELSVTNNGTYIPENGADGFSRVIVDVQGSGGSSDAPYSGTTPPAADLGINGDMYIQVFTGGSVTSDGSCYIDSGIIPNALYCVEIEAALTSAVSGYDTLFGCRNGQNSRFTARFGSSATDLLSVHKSSTPSASYSSYLSTTISKNSMLNTYYKLRLKDAWYENDLVQTTFKTSDVNTFPYGIFVFANNDAGSPSDFAHAKVKYFKAYDDTGELVCYLVGTQDGSGIACMYDLVTGTMKYNAGTGEFTYNSNEGHTAAIYWKKVGQNWEIFGVT